MSSEEKKAAVEFMQWAMFAECNWQAMDDDTWFLADVYGRVHNDSPSINTEGLYEIYLESIRTSKEEYFEDFLEKI